MRTEASRHTEAERTAAWQAHVELVTRIATVPLAAEGLLREAMNSLHKLIAELRAILRDVGPASAPIGGTLFTSAEVIASVIDEVRRWLTAWHPALEGWVGSHPDVIDPVALESTWPHRAQCRTALAATQAAVRRASRHLAAIAEVDDLTPAPRSMA